MLWQHVTLRVCTHMCAHTCMYVYDTGVCCGEREREKAGVCCGSPCHLHMVCMDRYRCIITHYHAESPHACMCACVCLCQCVCERETEGVCICIYCIIYNVCIYVLCVCTLLQPLSHAAHSLIVLHCNAGSLHPRVCVCVCVCIYISTCIHTLDMYKF